MEICNENEIRIRNKAKQTYSKVINKVNPSIVNNSCDFKLLERLCAEYQKQFNEIRKNEKVEF